MNIKISAPTHFKSEQVILHGSKSIANRLLIINRLADSDALIENLPEGDDVHELVAALAERSPSVNGGSGASTYRFLTALFAVEERTRQLNASPSMTKRPVGPLVDALISLGANIRYLAKKGYPPLLVGGKNLDGGEVVLDASSSSQFISSMLMIAPLMKKGLKILKGKQVVSSAYIDMTVSIMEGMGVHVKTTRNGWYVAHQDYNPVDSRVEGDWSSASYFYEIMALAERGNYILKGLSFESLQPDSRMLEIMDNLGFMHHQKLQGIKAIPGKLNTLPVVLNLSDSPDLFPALAALFGGIGVEATFSGIAHLKFKESDRIVSMKEELEKFGINCSWDGETWHQTSNLPLKNPGSVSSHGDHRVAMALAPLCIKSGSFHIEDAGVVSKSFPTYWETLKNVGFNIS